MGLIPPTDNGYCLWVVTPAGYTHSRAFEDLALALREAFAELGFEAPIITRLDGITGRAVVLGANLLAAQPQVRPPGLVLYNLEQVQSGSAWITPQYLDLLRAYPVWDYSARNIEALAREGVSAILCGVGYAPGLTRIPHAPIQDIEVLFVGSMNPRRRAALNDLAARGVKVRAVFGVYGPERDALIARAKIVINLHFYEAQLFEIVRVSYLLANRVCVVSESGLDAELEAPFREGVAFAPYDRLTQTCLDLLSAPERREALAAAGFAAFAARPQAPMLARALAALAPLNRG